MSNNIDQITSVTDNHIRQVLHWQMLNPGTLMQFKQDASVEIYNSANGYRASFRCYLDLVKWVLGGGYESK